MARGARPWSLVGRLTGGVALIAVLAFLSQALVLDFWMRPLLDEVAAEVAAHALTVKTALAALPAAQRPALAARLSNARLQVSLVPPGDPDGDRLGSRDEDRDDDGVGPPLEFVQAVRARVGPDVVVRRDLRPPSGFGAVLGVPLDGQTWWMSFAADAPRAALRNTLVFWLAVMALVTLTALLMSVRFIARPIGLLAAQIGGQRGRLQPIAVDPRASTELRALARSFNALVSAVDAANATRQQMLAGVSHDLRTPLARLRLRVETQCEPTVGDALATDLLSLERIVDQFLAYVQGDAGLRVGHQAPLAATVADIVGRYAEQGEPVSARIDPTEQSAPDLAVQRLLNNLVDNALAYGQGPVVVELATFADGAELRVFDQGPGMSQAEFERAQQPFVRLSAARGELGHCGLGLAIVAQIARQWGGALRIARSGAAFGIAVSIPARPGGGVAAEG